MNCLKEPLSRLANQQENNRGAFFEGRFKSVAILDDESLLATCAYLVDYTGRLFRKGKTPMSREVAEILQRVGTSADTWQARTQPRRGPPRRAGCSRRAGTSNARGSASAPEAVPIPPLIHARPRRGGTGAAQRHSYHWATGLG